MTHGESGTRDKGRLKVSLSEEFRGIRHVDLYVDYLQPRSSLEVIPHTGYTFTEYLRKVLAPVACPQCQSKQMSLSVAGGLRHWTLKMMGRRVFSCSQCSAQLVVKVHRWHWEVVGTTLAVLAILSVFSFHWLFR